jgi:hypothetical protein
VERVFRICSLASSVSNGRTVQLVRPADVFSVRFALLYSDVKIRRRRSGEDLTADVSRVNSSQTATSSAVAKLWR